MLKVTVNDSAPIEVVRQPDGSYLDGTLFDGDVDDLGSGRYHVVWRNRSYNVEVVELNKKEKRATLKIDGHLVTTRARNRFDLLLESMGMDQGNSNRVNEVKAPMPGLIQSVAVEEGATVQKGDTLLVLVAMKMENALKAPAEATVKAVRVEAGTSVEKNQVLIEFE